MADNAAFQAYQAELKERDDRKLAEMEPRKRVCTGYATSGDVKIDGTHVQFRAAPTGWIVVDWAADADRWNRAYDAEIRRNRRTAGR